MNNKSIIASTIFVAVATMVVRFSGYIREVTLASIYGAGMVSDAFIIAFTVPSIVLALFGASTATVFIPVYTRVKGDRAHFTNNILTLLALVGLIFTAVFATYPQALVFLFASQFNAEAAAITSELLRIMTWAAVPILLTGVLQSYLQIKNAFFLATVLTIPINVYTILSILLSRSIDSITVMGYGVVAGNIMAIIFLFAAAYCKGYAYRPVIDLKMPELKMLLVMITPVVITIFIGDINQIVDRNFASSLVAGSISSLNYAGKTISILVGTIGAPLATVLYPRMSELAAKDNLPEIRRCVTECVKRLIPILLPATLGIMILARPIIRVIFERGEFTVQNTQMAMECLRMYAPLLVLSSLNAVIIRALFSIRDTKTPAMITAASVGVGIVINIILIGPLAHMGLALSSSISAMISTILLLFVFRKRVGLLHLKRDLREWVKVLVATVIMGVVVAVGYYFLPVMGGGTFQSLLLAGGLVAAGIGVYILMHLVLRTVFIGEAFALVRKLLAARKDKGTVHPS